MMLSIKIKTILALFSVVLISCTDEQKDKFDVQLKNGNIEVFLFHSANDQLALQIKKAKEIVLDTSLLGIRVNERKLGSGSTISLLKTEDIDLSFALNGIKNNAHYKSDLSIYEVKESDGFTWQLHIQVSDQGVAYRYLVPDKGVQRITKELTTFKLPEKTKVWYFERDSDWKLKSHAGEWRSAAISSMPTISKMGPVQGLTLTCELPNGGYALLAEAALYNYSGLRLEAIGNNSFHANFEEGKAGFEIDGEVLTPWRCILLADSLNDLVNNTMVPSLNPPPDEKLFTDQTWIRPGKSVWHWWSGKYVDFDEEKDMIDDAVALDFKYSMVDDGWEAWDNKWEKITELANYAKKNGKDIFIWKHSDQLNFPENDYAIMRHFLDSVKAAGVVGIKVDFMNSQSKSIIAFDEALLRKAAKRQLMVNFHGCQQSSGEYRTYPNEVTREGIRGLEVNHMKEGPLPASHNVALPFTRYVTGHADYTPIGFTEPGETTWAHQLATLVTLYSPFNCIAENTQFLLNNKKVAPALDFIKEVPTVWDETIVLPDSEIGKLAGIARRKGDDWFVGIISSGAKKEIDVACSFLKDGDYTAQIFTDDVTAKPVNLMGLNKEANLRQWATAVPFKTEKTIANTASKITLKMSSNGGAVLHFKRN